MVVPPWSPSAERNRVPILRALRGLLRADSRVLEIGSGTGQHAAYFSRELPGIRWQTSEVAESLAGLAAGLECAQGANLPPPLELDVRDGVWPHAPFDGVFSANTAHIMSWREVSAMLAGAGRALDSDGRLILYGPFSRNGEHTSESNRNFDEQLRERDPAMGVRDLTEMDTEAGKHGFERLAEYAMPANNLLLVWRRS